MSTTVLGLSTKEAEDMFLSSNQTELSISITTIHDRNIKLVATQDKRNLTMVPAEGVQWAMAATEITKADSMIPRCSTTPNRPLLVVATGPIKEVSPTITEATPTSLLLAISITCITFLIFIQRTVTIYTASRKME
jgi:hypothetical protein